MSETMPKVVIIGAGMAGLSAARFLADNTNFEIQVLEANADRCGGRLWSYELPGFEGKPVELGGMWIHCGSDSRQPLTRLAHKWGIGLMEHDVATFQYCQTFDLSGKPYTADDMQKGVQVTQMIQEMCDEMIEKNMPDVSYEKALHILSETHKGLFRSDLVKHLIIPVAESYRGWTKDELSMVYFQKVAKHAKATSYEGLDLVVPSGYKKLLDKLITGGKAFSLELARQVTKVVWENGQVVRLDVTNPKNGETYLYEADHVILAVSLGVLKAETIQFQPALPDEQKIAIDRIGFNDKMRVILMFDQVFWPNKACFCLETSDPSSSFPLHLYNLHYIHQLPALLANVSGDGIKEAVRMNEKEIVEKILANMEKIFPEMSTLAKEHPRLIYTKVIYWSKEAFVKGGYSYGKVGMTVEDAYNVRKPIQPYLYFAGEHTAIPEDMASSAHGAYISGKRAAREVMKCRGMVSEEKSPAVDWNRSKNKKPVS